MDQAIWGNYNVQIKDANRSRIEVVFNGTPRLLPLEPALVPPAAKMPSPARLVRPHAGVVPFVDRGKLLARLQAWVATEGVFAGYLVEGRGGSGKTRLAVELCQKLRSKRWLCGFLARIADQEMLEELLRVPTAKLLVVDYAESHAEQLEFLLPLFAAHATREAPVRVLLLARTGSLGAAEPSRRLRTRIDALDSVIDEFDASALDDAPLRARERSDLFAGSLAAFADGTGAAVEEIRSPDLDEEDFASPLMVVIAAYLASKGHSPPPSSRVELLDELLDHERRYWRDGLASLDIDEALIERLVALATLVRAEDEAGATDWLRLLPDLEDASAERRGRIARWLRAQYPGPGWWNPLEPDLVGEHLVAGCFADRPEVLRGALAGSDPDRITRPLQVLARAAADSGQLAIALGQILSSELGRLSGVAAAQAKSMRQHDLLYGGGVTAASALNAAVASVEVGVPALKAGLAVLPADFNFVLEELQVTLMTRLVAGFRSTPPTEPRAHAVNMANVLSNLSVVLSNLGRNSEALAASEEAISIYRSAGLEAPVDKSRLANALANIVGDLAHAGRQAEALAASEEAVELYRHLAAADDSYVQDLARALNNLICSLGEAGRSDEALAASRDSVELFRRLAADDASQYLQDLCMALDNHSIALAEAEHHEGARAASEESVRNLRRLAESAPAVHVRALASAVNMLSVHLARAGCHDDALAASEESVELYRRLAESRPAAHTHELVMALDNLIYRLDRVGRRAEAARLQRELEGLDTSPHATTGAKPVRLDVY